MLSLASELDWRSTGDNLSRTVLNLPFKYNGVASFSTSCRPGWLSFPHILKIARMTSTHWPHQRSFSSTQQRIISYKPGVIKPKIVVGPGLQVYRLAMPLKCIFSYRRTISLQELIESHWIICDGFLDKLFRNSSLVQLTKKFIWSSRKKVIKNVKIPLPLGLVNHTWLKAMKSVRIN